MLSAVQRHSRVSALALSALLALPVIAQAQSSAAWLPATVAGPAVTNAATALDATRHQVLQYGGRVTGQHYGPGSYGRTYDIANGPTLFSNGAFLDSALPSTPGARESAALTYDPIADRMWLFGGDSLSTVGYFSYAGFIIAGQLNDLWYLDRNGASDWHRVTPMGPLPSQRYGASLVTDVQGRRLILFGGRDTLGNHFNDVWTWPLDGSGSWQQILPAGTPPAPTAFAHAVYDPVRQRLIITGGEGAGAANTFMALTLGPSPQWQALLVAGTAPATAIGALDYDASRDALLALAMPADLERIALASTPTWQPLSVATTLATSQLTYLSAMQYDSSADVIVLPGIGSTGYLLPQPVQAVHQRIALDRALSAPTGTAQFLGATLVRGRLVLRYQASVAGNLIGPLRLEGHVASDLTFRTLAFPADSIRGDVYVFSVPVAAGNDSWYRVGWSDIHGDHASDVVRIVAPPPPLAMPFTTDSAFVRVGQAHVQLTLANDSLTVAAQPVFERRTGSGSWSQAWPSWPDDARRMTLRDSMLAHGVSYEYALRFVNLLGDTVRTGLGTLIDNAPDPALASVNRGAHVFSGAWDAANTPPSFGGNLEVSKDGGAWSVQQAVVQNTGRQLPFAITPLRLGVVYRARLAWQEQGVTRYSVVFADTVPHASATVVFTPHSDRVDAAWHVSPPDSGLVWRIQRAPATNGPFATVAVIAAAAPAGVAFTGDIAYADQAVTPGSTYAYRIVADDGVGADTLASSLTATLHAPVLFAKHATPQQVDFDWYAPDAGTFNLALMRGSPGGETAEAALTPGDDGHAHYTIYPAQLGEVLRYRVRWQESDNVERFSGTDTTVVMPAQVDTLPATFGTYHVVTRWNVQPVDSTFFVALERSGDGGRTYSFITLYRTTAGPSFVWDDKSARPSVSYRYRLSWVLGTSPEVRGITGQVPLSGIARGRPDRVTVDWLTIPLPSTGARRHFAGTLERRVSSAPWTTLGTIAAVPLAGPAGDRDSLGYDDFSARVGQLYDYRVTWIDQGDTLQTAAISAAVPAVSASLFDVNSKPTSVTVRWQVTGDDPAFAMRVLRRESASSVWDTLGLSHDQEPGIRSYVDLTTTPGHLYSYKLIWQQDAATHTSEEHAVFAIGSAIQMGRPSPNPSHGGFSVPIGIPDAVAVRLTLYDIGGREQGFKTFTGPGVFTYTLPAGRFKAGVYFARLDDGRHIVTQRVVIVP